METKVVKVRSYFDPEPAREYRYPSRMSKKRKQNIHPVSVIISALIVILAASLPLMSIWFANQSEVSFIQAFLPASVFMVAGLLLFFVFLLITRRPYFSGVYSAFAIFLLADFQIVRGLVSLALKGAAEQYVSGLLGIIILVVVFILLHKFTKEVWLRYAVRIVSITLVGVMALSFIMGNPAFASGSNEPDDTPQAADTPTALATPTPTATATPVPTVSSTPAPSPKVIDGIVYANPELESSNLPNVYCFVLDEYGPPEITGKYYGFDNSLFVEFLKEHRFNRSSTSLCNIAETTWATGELHRLEPFLTKVSSSRARSYRNKNATLYKSFRSLGYATYSNSAVPRIFPAAKLRDNMDAFVDLSTLDRVPPAAVEPGQSGGTPTATPAPTVTPEPTPYVDPFKDFNQAAVENDWRYSFFTGSTEQDETMFDIAVDMSVLSFFVEKMSDSGMADEEDTSGVDPIASQEPESTAAMVQPSATQSISSPAPEVTPVETAYTGDYGEDGEDGGEDNIDQGISAPLDPDYATDPVPYDELAPIPKRLSVHAQDMYGVLSRLEELRTKGFAQPTFLISYFRQPHVPFMFDKNGKPLKSNVKYWWKNPNYYLGQLKFMTTHMMHIIDTILESDPDCVIIIQSDHGLRYRQLTFPLPDGVTKDEHDQYYVLNFVYYRGQVLNIEGLSPINTYRTVLTRLGLDMPLMEDPRALEFRGEKYGVPDGDPRLANVTNNN